MNKKRIGYTTLAAVVFLPIGGPLLAGTAAAATFLINTPTKK